MRPSDTELIAALLEIENAPTEHPSTDPDEVMSAMQQVAQRTRMALERHAYHAATSRAPLTPPTDEVLAGLLAKAGHLIADHKRAQATAPDGQAWAPLMDEVDPYAVATVVREVQAARRAVLAFREWKAARGDPHMDKAMGARLMYALAELENHSS